MISRRRFLENACAAAAAFGLPARVWGAADSLGKPDLVIGLLSDIHIQMPPTVARPEALDAETSVCVFSEAEIAADGLVRFAIRPANCWGVAGRPLLASAHLPAKGNL